jgi:hypothetical protein
MKRTNKMMIVSAAFVGLLAGTNSTSKASSLLSSFNGQMPSDQDGSNSKVKKVKEKHACKGQNSCKGKGGCKSSDNGCKGKNSCKGKGGCATDGAKMPDESKKPS